MEVGVASALQLDQGCQIPGHEDHNPTGFYDLPGRKLVLQIALVEAIFCPARQAPDTPDLDDSALLMAMCKL